MAATGTVAADRAWPPTGRELCWLLRSRLSNGEAMPDPAALIEEQIPGLRGSPAHCCAATGTGPTTSFRMPLNARFPIGISAERRESKGLALHDPLQPGFVRSASRAPARPTRPVVAGGRTAGNRRRAAFGAGASGSVARLCGIAGGAAGGASVGRRRGPLLPAGGACTRGAHRHGDVEAFARPRAFAPFYPMESPTRIVGIAVQRCRE